MKFYTRLLYTVCTLLMSMSLYAQMFEPVRLTQFTGNAVEGVPSSYTKGILINSMQAADVDNDGDFDLAICATNKDTDISFAKLYINNSTPGNLVLTESAISFPEAKDVFGWLDIDGDGRLDLYARDADKKLIAYINKSGSTFDIQYPLVKRKDGNVYTISPKQISWTDYDADGDLDMLSISELNEATLFVQNADKSLEESTTFYCISCIFSDYDGDGDADITDGQSVYTNVNGAFTKTHNLIKPNTGQSFSDYRATTHDFTMDGKMDIMASYVDNSNGSSRQRRPVYFYNTDNQFQTKPSFSDGFFNDLHGPLDLDHNGKLDVVHFGSAPNGYMYSAPFYSVSEINETKALTTESFGESYPFTTASVLGDFDKDGKIDFISAGTANALSYYPGEGVFAYFFRNKTATVNTAPSVPAQLTTTRDGNAVVISWDKSSDAITPQNSLEYNYYLRRSSDTLAFVSSTRSGKLKTIRRGNAGFRNSVRFSSLPNGTYQWSVQAIDHSNRASAFASELTFKVENGSFPINTLNGTAQRVVWHEQSGQYVMAYSKDARLTLRILDSDAQSLQERNTTLSASTMDILSCKSRNEIIITYTDAAGTWMQRINPFTLADVGTRLNLSNKTLDEVALAYNTKNDEFGVVVIESEGNGMFPNFKMYGQIVKIVNGQLQLDPAQTVYQTTVGVNQQFYYLANAAIAYNEPHDVYTMAWIARANDASQVNLNGNNSFQLLKADMKTIGSSISTNAGYPTSLKLEAGFNNNLMAVWQSLTRTQTGGFNDENFLRAARLTVNGPAASPTLNVENIPGNINFIRQGITGTSASEPELVFNSVRNEYSFLWRSGYDINTVLLQRFDVVDNTKVLNDEFSFNPRGSLQQVVHNPAKNNFLMIYNGNQYALYQNQKFSPPVVLSASRLKAFSGEKIIIAGNNFSKTPVLNTVMFGSRPATVTTTYQDGRQLEVIVPDGLTRAPVPISVSFDGQTATSDFMFENLTVANVSGIDIFAGNRGDVVTISGTELSNDPAGFTVKFGGVAAELSDIVSSTTEQIKVKVPQNAPRGFQQVSVIIQDIEVIVTDKFEIFVAPTITGITATEGLVSCKTITLQGKDFSTEAQDVTIMFGDTPALPSDISLVSNNAIVVKVPLGAQGTGDIAVTIGGRTGIFALDTPNKMRLGSELQASSPVPPSQIQLSNRKDDDVNLELRVLNQCSVKEVKQWTKGISQPDNAWKSVSLSLENNTGRSTLTEKDFTDPVGVNVFFEVIDLSTKKVNSDTFFIHKNFTEFDSLNQIPALSFGGAASDYNIVSIPYQLTPNNIPTVFKNLFNSYGYDSAKWRIFHYRNDNERVGYTEYQKGLNVVEPGKGYWMIVRNPQEIFFEGAQSVDLSDGPFEITLQPGWNQIGNPYNFNISWDDVIAYNDLPQSVETPKTFADGAFRQGMTIEKFRGAFVKYNGTQALKIKIPYTQNATINGGRKSSKYFPRAVKEAVWYTPLSLSSEMLSSELAGFGVHPDATNAADDLDEGCLPGFVNQFDISFAGNLSSSLVAPQADYHWDFSVRNATADQNLAIRWDNATLAGVEAAYLYDKRQQQIINMHETGEYAFHYSQSKTFAIYAGSESWIQSVLLPERNTLGKAYPNPFRETTHIPFTITDDYAAVSLVIYNLQGQNIATLVNDHLPRGFYEKSWDGRALAGSKNETGTFIYELKVNNIIHYGKVISQP